MGNDVMGCEKCDCICPEKAEKEQNTEKDTRTKVAGAISESLENSTHRILSTIDEYAEQNPSSGGAGVNPLLTTQKPAIAGEVENRSELRESLKIWNIYNSLVLDDRAQFNSKQHWIFLD